VGHEGHRGAVDFMSACIPTYMLASSLISEGMNWYQAVPRFSSRNAIVLVPRFSPRTRAQIRHPFPCSCRASFGIRGANIPPCCARLSRAAGRHPDMDRRLGRFTKSITIYVPAWDSLPTWWAASISRSLPASCFSGHQHVRHNIRHRIDPHPARH